MQKAWTYLEVPRPGDREIVPLEDGRIIIGRAQESDICLSADMRVSRVHAVLEHYGSGWCVRDLGSANGTYVNGRPITGERRLSTGDEIRIGSTRLLFKRIDPAPAEPTHQDQTDDKLPELTRRERQMLIALCRPLGNSSGFPEPATIQELARELFLSPPGVKYHLANLYSKFAIDKGSSRRRRLANKALQVGAVSDADLVNRGEPSL